MADGRDQDGGQHRDGQGAPGQDQRVSGVLHDGDDNDGGGVECGLCKDEQGASGQNQRGFSLVQSLIRQYHYSTLKNCGLENRSGWKIKDDK